MTVSNAVLAFRRAPSKAKIEPETHSDASRASLADRVASNAAGLRVALSRGHAPARADLLGLIEDMEQWVRELGRADAGAVERAGSVAA